MCIGNRMPLRTYVHLSNSPLISFCAAGTIRAARLTERTTRNATQAFVLLLRILFRLPWILEKHAGLLAVIHHPCCIAGISNGENWKDAYLAPSEFRRKVSD